MFPGQPPIPVTSHDSILDQQNITASLGVKPKLGLVALPHGASLCKAMQSSYPLSGLSGLPAKPRLQGI